MNKWKIFVWCLYDFANSFVTIAFFLYFSQWLVVERGVSDFWFNVTFTISSLLFLAIGPVLGSIADKTGNKTTGMRMTTLLSGALYFLTGVIAVSFPAHTLLATLVFIFASSAYLLSFVYYSSFLQELAPPEKHGLVSGWGLFGNYLGQIAAVIVSLPFATGAMTLWGEAGRAQAFIPATVIFILLSLPFLIAFKKPRKKEHLRINLGQEYKEMASSFVTLAKTRGLGRFFLAYFFFNDAVITASNNFPIYMDRVFGTSDTVKSYILLGILVTSAIGSPLSGWIADRYGLKKTLVGILCGWAIIFPLLAFAQSLWFVVLVTIVMGLWFGSAWTVTRAMVIGYAPQGRLNQSFTYYTFMERFATLIGPLSWGLVVTYGPHEGALSYRLAAFLMTAFILIGLFAARGLPEIHRGRSRLGV